MPHINPAIVMPANSAPSFSRFGIPRSFRIWVRAAIARLWDIPQVIVRRRKCPPHAQATASFAPLPPMTNAPLDGFHHLTWFASGMPVLLTLPGGEA